MKPAIATAPQESGLVRDLGVLDCTTIVAGSMIGSGVFIVSADIARQVGSTGWLLATWGITGILTIVAALAYGELAGMMPRSGGQYVYLREAYSPLWGFLYGWTLFLVIQTGTISAVAVAFARFLGVLVPSISPTEWILPPINLSTSYAISLSTQQLVAIALIVFLSAINTRGIRLAKVVQNVFTTTKMVALLGLIVLGIGAGAALSGNLASPWTAVSAARIDPDLSFVPTTSASDGLVGLLVALCVAQVGSLFSADAWNNIGFAAGEVRNPRRDVALGMVLGTGVVTVLYVLANVAYLTLLPLSGIQAAPDDRVATAALEVVFGPAGATIMALAIMISTFGCNNGLILTGARAYFAMARDGLFFRPVARLSERHVPAVGLWLQCAWASLLVLPRTRLRDAAGSPLLDGSGLPRFGNLYGNLLDYVVFSVLVFYVLTIAGVFVLRRKRPDAPRPYRALGYPYLPAVYILAAVVILCVLLLFKTSTTWPGLVIVLSGIPVYFVWRGRTPGNSSGRA